MTENDHDRIVATLLRNGAQYVKVEKASDNADFEAWLENGCPYPARADEPNDEAPSDD